MRIPFITLALVLTSGAALAQIKTPQPSPAATVTQTIGVTNITINYSRPGVKAREIFGKLVPFGEIWRAGANACTTIEFGDDVTIGDKKVPAGRYSFFAIPQRDEWTLVLNKNAALVGTAGYKETEDAARWKVKPEASEMTEWLTYTITPEGKDSGIVTLQWEKVRVPFKFTVDLRASVKRAVEASMTTIKDTDVSGYYNAARAFFENDIDLNKAFEWNEMAVKIRKGPGNLSLRGRILLKQGKKGQAAESLKEAIALATERKLDKLFIEELNGYLAEAQK
ncbi:MAG: DUF2911 domain-containing protein [Planctomycetota bacterium]